MNFESNSRYDGYTHSAALEMSTNFDDVQPVHIQGAFREIDAALRINGAHNQSTASALTHLRRCADEYVSSVRRR